MKKVLYLSNIEVPYRVRFFNELARHCELTVLYERQHSSNRDAKWAQSEERLYQVKYLHGIKLGGENSFSLGILKDVLSGYDHVIVGCCNSPSQMMAMLVMRLLRRKYILNLDGEPFLEDGGLKGKIKRFFVRKAHKYLVAGEKAARSVEKIVGDRPVFAYPFSSLTRQENADHAALAEACRRDETVLVVGQYFDYKGMDVALAAARMDHTIRYKFVGMGGRTELFRQEQQVPENVEIIDFLQKQDLEREYQTCGALLLPTRQECWGLVVNEAASFGMPIVSTWGSGAAVEFLSDSYGEYLAQPDDPRSLYMALLCLKSAKDTKEYSKFLVEKAGKYSIEDCVQAHLMCMGEEIGT